MKEKIAKILKNASGADAAHVFVPEKENFGHYSTNVALRLAKIGRKEPMAVADDLLVKLEKAAPKGFFEKIAVAPPGFINFWLSEATLHGELKKIMKEKEKYGGSTSGKGRKVQVEFVSANPTGPLTLANGRGGFLGDALSNALEFSGYKVEREFYINDAGNQILTLGKSVLAALGDAPWEESFYKGEYVKEWAKKHRALAKKHLNSPMKLGQLAARDFLAGIKKVLSGKAGIKFDRWTSEDKNIRKRGLALKALEAFKKKKVIYEKDGAVWLKTTAFGDDKDRVVITSDGYPTYFLGDAGHYLETKQRGFGGKILILGPDHYGYVKRIQAVAELVGLKNSEAIITQAIRLVRDGAEVKMSKRKGEFVTFEELVDEVGTDAARFFMLAVAPQTHMDFDLKLAKEHSEKNPVYYAQYSYVRAKNILGKARSKTSAGLKYLPLLSSEADGRLVRALAKFPEALDEAAGTRAVHGLTRYATELASAFHNFYEKERVLQEEKRLRAARLVLVESCLVVFTNLFRILGISRPSKM